MSVYDGLSALIGARVTDTGDHYIEFDNGLRIECEDVGNYIDVSGYKEAKFQVRFLAGLLSHPYP